MITEESHWNPKAVSPQGAQGLGQLLPSTAKSLGVKNTFDPIQNITGTVKYTAQILRRFNHSPVLTIAAFNAGPTRVAKLGRVPNIKETKDHIRKVCSHMDEC